MFDTTFSIMKILLAVQSITLSNLFLSLYPSLSLTMPDPTRYGNQRDGRLHADKFIST